MDEITVILADSHRVVMEGIKSALRHHSRFVVAGEACTGREALRLARSVKPDIIIMDIPMPDFIGILPVLKIRASLPESRIIIFSMRERKEYLPALVKAGIVGYVPKDAQLTELVRAANAASSGKMYFSSAKAASSPPVLAGAVTSRESVARRSGRLTSREREIFRCIADGRPISEIAAMLGRSRKTVESQKYRIMEKLNAQTLSDLVRIAVKRQIVRL